MNDCESAKVTLSTDAHGRTWEHFHLGDRYIFSNQIPDIRSFSATNPGQIIADRGLCAWSAPVQAVAPTEAAMGGGDGAVGVLLLLGLIGSGIYAWFNRDQIDDRTAAYSPMSDVPPLPIALIGPGHTPPQGNRTDVTPRELPDELPENSSDFAENSDDDAWQFPLELPPGQDETTWPPKSMGAAYDPLEPEQGGEFDDYRNHIEADGLSARGNDILKRMWGVTPGRSKAYQAARKRRDEFAKRLDYYRYEEA